MMWSVYVTANPSIKSYYQIYTNKFQLDQEKFHLFKYADDMALVALLMKGDIVGEEVYRARVISPEVVLWKLLRDQCNKNTELVFHGYDPVQPLIIKWQIVEVVNKFKYLGTYIDGNRNFSENTDYIFKTCNVSTYYASSTPLEWASTLWKQFIRTW